MPSLDRVIKFESSRAYPSIPTVSADVQSLVNAVSLMKHSIEIHERRTKNLLDSFVRVQELVDLGLIDLNGNQLAAAVSELDGSVSEHIHTIAEVTSLTEVLVALQSVDADFETRISTLEADAVATFAVRIDEEGSIIYIGEAIPGTLNAANDWRIQRVTFTVPGEADADIEWAAGASLFDQIWDDRVSLVYS